MRTKNWFQFLRVVWIAGLVLSVGVAMAFAVRNYARRSVVDVHQTELLCVDPGTDLLSIDGIEMCPFNKLQPDDRVLSRRSLLAAGVRLSQSEIDLTCKGGPVWRKLQTVCGDRKTHGDAIVELKYATVGGPVEIAVQAAWRCLAVLLLFGAVRRVFYFLVLRRWNTNDARESA